MDAAWREAVPTLRSKMRSAAAWKTCAKPWAGDPGSSAPCTPKKPLISLRAERVERRGDCTAFSRLLGRCLAHFDSIGVRRAVHVRTENDPLAIGREGHIGFQSIVMLGQVHELFRWQDAVL